MSDFILIFYVWDSHFASVFYLCDFLLFYFLYLFNTHCWKEPEIQDFHYKQWLLCNVVYMIIEDLKCINKDLFSAVEISLPVKDVHSCIKVDMKVYLHFWLIPFPLLIALFWKYIPEVSMSASPLLSQFTWVYLESWVFTALQWLQSGNATQHYISPFKNMFISVSNFLWHFYSFNFKCYSCLGT